MGVISISEFSLIFQFSSEATEDGVTGDFEKKLCLTLCLLGVHIAGLIAFAFEYSSSEFLDNIIELSFDVDGVW